MTEHIGGVWEFVSEFLEELERNVEAAVDPAAAREIRAKLRMAGTRVVVRGEVSDPLSSLSDAVRFTVKETVAKV